MKRVFYLLMVCAVFLLNGCEEHDGTEYFKSKCVAQLNGQTYIDQNLFSLSPDVIVTPGLDLSDNNLGFLTMLRTERKGSILYTVEINLYAPDSEILLTKEQMIEKVDAPEGESSGWEYIRYCKEHKISYARINDEIVDKGSFKITSYDKEKRSYHGTFSITFSQGTMTAEFDI